MILLIVAIHRAITFEKAVDSLGIKFKVNKLKGIKIDPPEIPEIDPIPERIAIHRIPKISIPKRLKMNLDYVTFNRE